MVLEQGASAAAVNLYIVADGMGGAEAGEVASRLAIRAFASHFLAGVLAAEGLAAEDLERIGQASVDSAHSALADFASGHPGASDLGTTLTVLGVAGRLATVVHVGDTRCYRIRHGEVSQFTTDHSVVARLVEIGELTLDEARNPSAAEHSVPINQRIAAGRATDRSLSKSRTTIDLCLRPMASTVS